MLLALRLLMLAGLHPATPTGRAATLPDSRPALRALLPGLFALALFASQAIHAAPRVLVLGDSISAAYGMSLEQGWVALLEQQLGQRWEGTELINASISGDTSAGGLRRLPQLLEEHQPDLLVLELGGNDGLRGYPTNKLRDNLVSMASQARDQGSKVLILPMEIPPNYGPRYTSAFRDAFRSAADSTGATLGPFMLDGIGTEQELMQGDGIHPTVEAQPLIANILRPAIESLLQDLEGS